MDADAPVELLLVDQSEADAERTLRALAPTGLDHRARWLRDGQDALDYLHAERDFAGRPPGLPRLILLDIAMPRVDGLSMLRAVRGHSQFAALPIVMLTASRAAIDIGLSYRFGANGYVVKPADNAELAAALATLADYWLGTNRVAY
jgi:two-component system response regulator